jgi:transcription-repair coupling factor (superfamily II helicase)
MTMAELSREKSKRSIIGLTGSAPAWYIASLQSEAPKALVVCPTRRAADELVDDLQFFLGSGKVTAYPAWETLPLEPVSPPAEISAQRIKALHVMQSTPGFLVITSADALLQKVAPSSSIDALSFSLRQGERIDRLLLSKRLLAAGFRVVKNVERIGEVAFKGAVIDLYTSGLDTPVRIELADEEIARIKAFDPETQRSLLDLSEIDVIPVRELTIINDVRTSDDSFSRRLKDRAFETSTPSREVEKVLQAIASQADYPGMELLQYVAATTLCSVFDYLPVDTTVFLVDRFEIQRSLDEFATLAAERSARLIDEQHLIPNLPDLYLSTEQLLGTLSSFTTEELSHVELLGETSIAGKSRTSRNVRAESNIELSTRMKSSIGSGEAFSPLKAFLDQWRAKKYSVAFAVGSAHRAQRLQTILLNIGTDAPILSTSAQQWIDAPRRPEVAVLVGHLLSGFRLPTQKLLFVSENEIFGERSYRTGKAPRISAKRLLSSLSLLKEGDYVAHIDYGIGIYQGLRHLTVDGILGDFLQLDYSDSKLYLPAHQIGKIQKFVATEGQQPTVDKLGSTRWARAKQKIRDSIVTLAGDLIRLYAGRSVARGWRFEPFGAEDERFADSFQYDETPDQRKAIQETVADLAAEKPMDRLVCGDVGFGKTEVAIRAAFKCTQHARQVAVLVPTTILVEQHKKNFADRFANYPVKVGAVSRFYPAEENLKTLRGVALGDIDIVIGTHRLLQPDVQFKDLGLLIIDEEHRFGVKQKERLRSYRTNVDVLTLTATPIPRTLHMSLLGIRDISLISTAPVDRKIVQTYLAEKDDSLTRDAILRELRRGGQSFFIHNRVQNIAAAAARLAELVPEAKFDFAHGQMTDTQLEGIMKRFLDRELDVLVTTTIVESGLDVPNANTIIIDRADQFGLAQLYQLRGRVGRSKRQAYAYFLVPHVKNLSHEAQERLKVLQSLDTLGVGFNLALRDLEIRGAGNLLGKEQSGSVLSVGFDMYCRILGEAVADLKGEEPQLEDVVDPDVRIVGVDAYIPEAYVPDIGERLVLYQRLSNIRTDDEAYDLLSEIEDRFGPCALEVNNLMTLMRFRGLLRRYGVVKSEVTPLKASLTFSPIALLRDGFKPTANTRVDGLKALRLVEQQPHRYRFGRTNALTVMLPPDETVDLNAVVRQVEAALRLVAYVG